MRGAPTSSPPSGAPATSSSSTNARRPDRRTPSRPPDATRGRATLGEDLGDRLARGDGERAIQGVVELGGGVDAERPEQGGGDVVGRDGIARGIGADPVAGAVD